MSPVEVMKQEQLSFLHDACMPMQVGSWEGEIRAGGRARNALMASEFPPRGMWFSWLQRQIVRTLSTFSQSSIGCACNWFWGVLNSLSPWVTFYIRNWRWTGLSPFFCSASCCALEVLGSVHGASAARILLLQPYCEASSFKITGETTE